MNKDEALKMAIEQLGWIEGFTEALQPLIKEYLITEQEAVAWGVRNHKGKISSVALHKDEYPYEMGEPLYTHPHQFIGLTDDEIRKVYFELYDSGLPTMCFAHAIEQALKEKNEK